MQCSVSGWLVTYVSKQLVIICCKVQMSATDEWTNYVEQFPRCGRNSSSANQQTPCILRNSNVHCLTHSTAPNLSTVSLRSAIASVSVLFFKLHLDLTSGVFPSGFTTKPLYARGGAVCWGTALRAGRSRFRFLMAQLRFFIDCTLPAVVWPLDRLSL
jgi:hypothetical protein